MVGRGNTTNVGGAAAQESISYQNRVAAWFAVRMSRREKQSLVRGTFLRGRNSCDARPNNLSTTYC